jgi:hypothetical protein
MNSVDTTTYWVYYNNDAAGSKIDIPVISPTLGSILKASPFAFFNSLTRPYLFESKNPLMFFSALENFFIAGSIVLVCFFLRKPEYFHVVLFCGVIVVFLFTLVGITTAILGASVRYKMPALPFLFMLLLLVFDKEKFLKKFPFMAKFLR